MRHHIATTLMDHEMADKQQSAVKYLLNELPQDEREEFEQHLFECAICADQVRQDFTVVENLKEVLREEKVSPSRARPARSWLDWLQPASLIPACSALALAAVLAFQNMGSGPASLAQVLPEASIIAPVARGVGESPVKVDRSKPNFLLSFMVEAANPDSFICDFQKDSGSKIVSLTTKPYQTASFSLNVLLATKSFPPGRYQLVLHTASSPQTSTTYSFAIEDGK